MSIMSEQTHRCLVSFAVASALAMVCLVESRPSSGVARGGIAGEAVIDWISQKKGYDLSDGNQPLFKEAPTDPRILNHRRRASNERDGAPFANSSRFDSGSKPRKEDTTIIFPSEHDVKPGKPDTIGPKIKTDFELDTSAFKACAKDEAYCTEIDEYPLQKIEDLLANNIEKFQGFFGADKVKEPSLVNRIDDDPNDLPLCASTETTVFPKVAQNEQNKPMYIVNLAAVPESQQGVRVEKCHTKAGSCAFSDSFPNGHRAYCKQKHIYRRLLALNANGQPYPDSFLFPSCCVCAVKIENIASRMGFPLKPDTSPLQRNNAPNNAETKTSEPEAVVTDENTSASAKNNTQKPVAAPSQKTSSKIVFMDTQFKPLPLAEGQVDEKSN